MDRYSLGLAVHGSCVQSCLYNVDTASVAYCVEENYTLEKGVADLLRALDTSFSSLKQSGLLQQVAMIKVSGDPSVGILCAPQFYKALMTNSGYAESLTQHFKDAFVSKEFILPTHFSERLWEEADRHFFHNGSLSKKSLALSLKQLQQTEASLLEKSVLVLSPAALVASLLAGKRAPIDISLAISSGLSNDGQQWSDAMCLWVSDTLKEKLGEIKTDNNNFSYLNSYFVEKYGFYREVRLLAAGSNTAGLACGAGNIVFLDTQEALQLGAVVSEIPPTQNAYILNGLGLERFLCFVKTESNADITFFSSSYQMNFKNTDWAKLKVHHSRNGYDQQKFSLDQAESLLTHLLRLKENSRPFDRITVSGALAKEEVFLQLCADLFTSEITTFEFSTFATALGNALIASRKIHECTYREAIHAYFSKSSKKIYRPTNEGMAFWIDLALRFKNLAN